MRSSHKTIDNEDLTFDSHPTSTMNTNLNTNANATATDGLEINSNNFSSAVAHGSADDGHNQRTNKKSRKNKVFAIVSIATLAIIFGWAALNGMKQPSNGVQEHEKIQRDLAKSSKSPSSKSPKRDRDLAKSSKSPSSKSPKRDRDLAKSSKSPSSKSPKRDRDLAKSSKSPSSKAPKRDRE